MPPQSLELKMGYLAQTAPETADVIEPGRRTITYLIQSVVGGDGDGVGVHHQPLPEQREQAVRVHDLNLPPAGNQNAHVRYGFMTVATDIDCH